MDELVSCKIPAEKKEALQAMADKRGLNLSNLLRMIIYEHIASQE